jgi:ABC-2 type transport system ATP-binding protein
MDEAARCTRVGFMRLGRMIAEGTPSSLRNKLDGRIVELRGGDLTARRQIAQTLDGVQDVRAFGDKLHLRVKQGKAEEVISALKTVVQSTGAVQVVARLVPPTLEDVFITLAEGKDQ